MLELQTIKTQCVKLNDAGMVPPPVLVFGGPGTGKTTTGKELASQMDAELKMIQCSRWNNETAQEIRNFCITAQANINFLLGDEKPIRMVMLDEIDQFGETGQNQLRPIIDDFNETVFFYATTNYLDRVPSAVADRFMVTEIVSDEKSMRQRSLEKRMSAL